MRAHISVYKYLNIFFFLPLRHIKGKKKLLTELSEAFVKGCNIGSVNEVSIKTMELFCYTSLPSSTAF